MADRIVLNIPHSSFVFPFGFDAWEEGMQKEIERLTDKYTDRIFVPDVDNPNIFAVIYPYSRFFCDVERLMNDPMEEIGQGIIYKRFNGKKRDVPVADDPRIMATYMNHIRLLRACLKDEQSFMVDCHSFPPDLSDVEICIGLNDDWSRPSDTLINNVIGIFESYGLKTAINTPFSNSISPEYHFRYKSLMIEINKKLYLNENGALLQSGIAMLKKAISEVYQSILTK